MSESEYDDLTDFFRSRAQWLRVTKATNETGGVDVVLRLDGSYSPPGYIAEILGAEVEAEMGGADEMVEYFREQLEPLLLALGLGPQMTDWALTLEES